MQKIEIEIMRNAHKVGAIYDVVLPDVPRIGDTVLMGHNIEDSFTVQDVFWNTVTSTVRVRVK